MTHSDHLTCREFVGFVADYLSCELPDAARDEFDRHLNDCPNCVRYLESYKATVALGRTAFECTDDEIPKDVPEELIQAILAAQRES